MAPTVITTADKLKLDKQKEQRQLPQAAAQGDRNGTVSKEEKRNGAVVDEERKSPAERERLTPASQPSKTKKKSKQKLASPFRIKVGCVVSLRLRPEGNDITVVRNNDHDDNSNNGNVSEQQEEVEVFDYSTFVPVWTSPISGRDECLALIGKRVRCFLPKVVADQKRRVLEGEVIRLLDFCNVSASLDHDPSDPSRVSLDIRKQGRPIKIELLVDRTQLDFFPFLSRMDEVVDESKLSTDQARRNHRLEEKIRGVGKASVRMKLADPVSMAAMTGSAENRSAAETSAVGVRWVVQKLIPAKLFHEAGTRENGRRKKITDISLKHPGEKANEADEFIGEQSRTAGAPAQGVASPMNDSISVALKPEGVDKTSDSAPSRRGSERKHRRQLKGSATKHVGDKNDPAEQQIVNWRWLAGRYHDILLSANISNNPLGVESLSGGLIGEVLKVETASSATSNSSLATVTLRRLALPEHTTTGRLPHHRALDVFESCDDSFGRSRALFKVPIEQLIVVARKLKRVESLSDGKEQTSLDQLVASHSYSFHKDLYFPLGAISIGGTHHGTRHCHRCRRTLSAESAQICGAAQCYLARPGSNFSTAWCQVCSTRLQTFGDVNCAGMENMPCCQRLCDCRRCNSFSGSELCEDLARSIAELGVDRSMGNEYSHFNSTLQMMANVEAVDFGLPDDFLDISSLPKPLSQPSNRKVRRNPKYLSVSKVRTPIVARQYGKSAERSQTRSRPENGMKSSKKALEVSESAHQFIREEDYSVFKPTCARHLDYGQSRKFVKTDSLVSSCPTDRPRNMRLLQVDQSGEGEKKDEKTSSRAARANQRRLLKGVALIGASRLGVDALANREPQLRFDRSGIHAWGVFADEDISADVMIVEYRGELIGNAVAEKREKEYNAAKIGSDYMFRIDGLNVCDATKQGNVARFINASCDPNCYTKIITLDGNKRIVIYSKRDIATGEELCYDYKFPLEYDESKRIPCHCGAKDCRGFMNWVGALSIICFDIMRSWESGLLTLHSIIVHWALQDKRYVVSPAIAGSRSGSEVTEARPLEPNVETTSQATDGVTVATPRTNFNGKRNGASEECPPAKRVKNMI